MSEIRRTTSTPAGENGSRESQEFARSGKTAVVLYLRICQRRYSGLVRRSFFPSGVEIMAQWNELLEQIEGLDSADRAQLLGTLLARRPSFPVEGDADLPAIVRSPDVCGGSARLIRTRIPVWALARMRQAGLSDEIILENYPSLLPADLLQAWEYADRHRDEITREVGENEDA